MKILMVDRKINAYIRNKQKWEIINSLRKKIELEDIWILVEPSLDKTTLDKLDFNYKNFEEYNTENILEILQKEKPDVITISNDYDFFIRAFIPAAKFLKIPIVMLLLISTPTNYLEKMDLVMMQGKISVHKNKISSILHRFKFLIKTYRITKHSIFEIFKLVFNELFISIFRYHPWGEGGCDLVLVVGDDWKKTLEHKKIKSKIIVTGWPALDHVHNKILELEKKSKTNKKFKIVLMTAPMIEHGLWSFQEWEKTLDAITNEIKTNFAESEFVIKIHPSSENIPRYQKYLKERNLEISLYQKEDLMDVIFDADIVLTYAQSNGIIEAACMKKPVIVVNLFKYPIDKMPFLKEGLAYEIQNIQDLKKAILDISNNNVKDRLDQYISRYLYKFDGKSSERMADEIIKFVQEYKNRL